MTGMRGLKRLKCWSNSWHCKPEARKLSKHSPNAFFARLAAKKSRADSQVLELVLTTARGRKKKKLIKPPVNNHFAGHSCHERTPRKRGFEAEKKLLSHTVPIFVPLFFNEASGGVEEGKKTFNFHDEKWARKLAHPVESRERANRRRGESGSTPLITRITR